MIAQATSLQYISWMLSFNAEPSVRSREVFDRVRRDAVVLSSGALLSLAACGPSCQTTVLKSADAPAPGLVAVEYLRTCGSAGRTIQVALLEQGGPIGTGRGNLSSSHMLHPNRKSPTPDAPEYQLEWVAADHLIVHYPADLPPKDRRSSERGVKVEYMKE
ncbi:MAG: hypothetical protein ABJD11_02355 [Gemmatimonadota bacterium]